MKIKHLALLTTALTLSMSAAMASDANEAYLLQNGFENSGSVNQSGGTGNRAGAVGNAMEQILTHNALTILQSGNNNTVGTSAFNSNPGVLQSGGHSEANVTQSSNGNDVGAIQQIAIPVWPTTARTNMLTILQEGTNGSNSVASVEQNYTGDSTGETNVVNITQTRTTAFATTSSHDEAGNAVGNVKQDGTLQSATLTQTGGNNQIDLIDQDGSGNSATVTQTTTGTVIGSTYGNVVTAIIQNNTGFTLGNTATVTQLGQRNGQGIFTNGGLYDFAGGVGAADSTVEQNGGDNSVSYSAVGDDNKFGFKQLGTGNTVGLVDILGSGNETAAYQEGTGNVLNLLPIDGNDNNIGVIQAGFGGVGIAGFYNLADISLTGGSDRNRIGVAQYGWSNGTDIYVDGDDNRLNVQQIDDNPNGVDVDIIGNDNNNGVFDPLGVASSVSLTPGDITQIGHTNTMMASITGDNNLFATSQSGNNNTITATVNGYYNEFAVTQVGYSNVATLTQSGSYNNAVIMQ